MMIEISARLTTPHPRLDRVKLLSAFSIFLLVVAMLHHFVLCFINTNLFGVNGTMLIIIELVLLGITFGFFLFDATLGYILLILFIITNAFILFLFQGLFEPKNIRNFLVPVLMIWLGSRYNQKLPVDRMLVIACSVIVGIGLFELFLPSLFQKMFNILDFLVSTGRLSGIPDYAETSFALNGTRYGGRNMLSFLGDHRVSSIFLETVTVSNFATVMAAWGLSKSNFKEGMVFLVFGMVIAVLADSRFGTTTIILLLLLKLFSPRELLKYTAYLMPLIILFLCFYIGRDYTVFRDDFETRLGSTGHYIMRFTPLEFFGLSNDHYHHFLDQGYAKLLHFNGIILALALWVSFCCLRVNDDAVLFKYFIAIIISTNLAVSGDSIFSFKWVVVMWFLLGTQLIKKAAFPSIRSK